MSTRICPTVRNHCGSYYVCECTTTSTVYGIGYKSKYCPECGGLIREVEHGKEQAPES